MPAQSRAPEEGLMDISGTAAMSETHPAIYGSFQRSTAAARPPQRMHFDEGVKNQLKCSLLAIIYEYTTLRRYANLGCTYIEQSHLE